MKKLVLNVMVKIANSLITVNNDISTNEKENNKSRSLNTLTRLTSTGDHQSMKSAMIIALTPANVPQWIPLRE